MDQDFVGVYEIAALAKVTPAAVTNWRSRFSDFPRPVSDLKSGPVFERDTIMQWLKKRRIPMSTVISFINLKGGVAKTTTTVAVAQMLDSEFHKRVLIVDLDPQTNATVMLIGDARWKQLNEKHQTVAQIFKDALSGQEKLFQLSESIQAKVGNVADVQHLSLLPSSIDLIDVQDNLASMDRGRFYAAIPIELLLRTLRATLETTEYDYILIDCPPSLGLVTLNGLRISDYYIIPTIPDFLSTYGIPQIMSRIKDFSETIGKSIEPLGILATKYRAQSPVHNNQLKILRQRKEAPLFNTVVPENSDIAGAAEYKPVSTMRQKWGYGGQFDIYRALTSEILDRVNGGK
jgi:chromosome partitioning protein